MEQEFWEDRKVLVTGASGLLGSTLVSDLILEKADVVCLLRDMVPKSALFERVLEVNLATGSVTDQPVVERVLGEYEVETVFHLAAQTQVGVANNNPVSTFDSNIKGTWTVLEACRRSPLVNAVIVASTDKAYGCQDLPYTEDMPLNGRYPYDVSKVCADILSQSYAETYGLPVSITRCANFYGPGDLNWNRLIPGTIRSLIRGQPPVIRSDGSTIRDYLYIYDGVSAYLTLARHLLEDRDSFIGESFNFSTKTPISTLDLVSLIQYFMGTEMIVKIENLASNEIQEQWLSSEKANRMLNWYPEYTLNQGLKETIAWYRGFLK
jgi:CDP-glucose 4,6-dehydratase